MNRTIHDRLTREVTAILADAGCAGWVHAESLGRPDHAFGAGADAPVVLASVYKLPLMISLCRMSDRGELDMSEQVEVAPDEWSSGATGLALLHDPVRMSWRDLATSMMTVSDNVAADVILTRVGLDTVLADLADLRLAHTRIVGGMRELHARLQSETGTSTVAEAFAALSDPDVDADVSAYDAAYSSASTPRDCTSLLAALWRDDVAVPETCDFIRATMRAQVLRSRLASGFPFRHVAVAGKTGTLAAIRNEIGVVEFPGEHPVAIAVFTKSARSDPSLPEVDRAIGRVARAVVTELRLPT
ncbi:serine hydrolase [Gordonia insulae]|uniref:Beta-lactamase regulatory protein BlaB n=1 Tax=Gordonia insulae TaxID=2420509 RepID=A0A3G8JPT2_9ACTN|nr:serine hydrolase [Gordonia insulae]AZG47124.1 Beta-lactamase regulatory protein BlaB [Gordonia insulae]